MARKDTLEDVLSNPLYNLSLPLPSSKTLIDRILSNPILQGHYRPDIYEDYWDSRPPEGEVRKALDVVAEGLHHTTAWRTARDHGICWRNYKKDRLRMLQDLALTLFANLGPPKK